MLKLNVGSGQRPFARPLWTNVDINKKWRPDVIADGSSMPMFESGSADIVVLHHVLEHFGCGEGAEMVRECHRILCPGGSLLVFVPNMVALAHMWIKGQINTQVYMTNIYGAYMDSEADRHKWGFVEGSLKGFLQACSHWEWIDRFDWLPIAGADIAKADWVLGLRCEK